MRPNALSLSVALCLALPAAASFAQTSAAHTAAPDGATPADSGDRWSGMVAVGHRQGVEQKNQGDRAVDGSLRTVPSPQERDGRSLLAKLVYASNGAQRWRLTVGMFNLGDKKYTDWADVPGVALSSTTLDRYTRAGRSFATSVSVDW